MLTQGVRLTLTQFPHNRWYEDSRGVYVFIGDVAENRVAHVEASEHVTGRLKGSQTNCDIESLQVFHINDLHGSLAVFDDDLHVSNRFSKVISYIDQKRVEDREDAKKGMLFFSGGDEIAGSPFEQLWIETDIHAVYQVYNQIGLSAAVLGNHEFDLGPELLARAITMHARFPILAANLIAEGELATCVFPAAIFNVDGLRVGVIGVTTAEYAQKNPAYRISDPVQAIKNILPAVQDWSDLVIVLSHTGFTVQGDLALANGLASSGIDLIIGAHTHSTVVFDVNDGAHVFHGIPVTQAGSHAHYLGESVFAWNHLARDGGFVSSRLLPTNDLKLNGESNSAVECVLPFVELVQEMMQRPIGPPQRPEFGYHQDQVEATYDSGRLPLPGIIADAILSATREIEPEVDFSLVDRSVVQAGFTHSGQGTLADWLKIIPYVDEIWVARLTGHELINLINDNLKRISIASRLDDRSLEMGICYFSQEIKIVVADQTNGFAVTQEALFNNRPIAEQLERTFVCAFPSFLREMASEWERTFTDPLFEIKRYPTESTGLLTRDAVLGYVHQLDAYPGSDIQTTSLSS